VADSLDLSIEETYESEDEGDGLSKSAETKPKQY
jgi:hypothetical protein